MQNSDPTTLLLFHLLRGRQITSHFSHLSLHCIGHNIAMISAAPQEKGLPWEQLMQQNLRAWCWLKKIYIQRTLLWKNSSWDQASHSQRCECNQEPNTEGSESRALYFWAVLCFLCRHKKNKSTSWTDTDHCSLTFILFLISGILTMSPLLCSQVLCCCKLPHLHTSPYGTQEMGKTCWCSLNSLISICPSPAGETAQTKNVWDYF